MSKRELYEEINKIFIEISGAPIIGDLQKIWKVLDEVNQDLSSATRFLELQQKVKKWFGTDGNK